MFRLAKWEAGCPIVQSALAAAPLRRDSLRWLAQPKLAKPAKAGAEERTRTFMGLRPLAPEIRRKTILRRITA